ncbi:MAG: hypothetical protein J7L11_00720 [Thermoprotei archaeon]|nr:hypothetical protein [Thermoprotei archaeon]
MGSVGTSTLNIDARSIVLGSRPEKLKFPISPRVDHADHIVKTALMGHTKLAADHILHPEMRGKLVSVLSSTIRRLNLEFIKAKVLPEDSDEEKKRKVIVRQRCYEVLIELALDLVGMEARWVGFSEEEVNESLNNILSALGDWESIERSELGSALVANAVIGKILSEMKLVRKGDSMLAEMAREIEKELDKDDIVRSFVLSAKRQIQENVYYKMISHGMCKFGNDYALGLRWLRHLGYVQVSTNPVLAAIAYDDNPRLWDDFKEVVKEHPEWLKDPEAYADEIAMEATRVGLMENFYVFRPPFLLKGYTDGMISYQLNPLKAGDAKASVEDAIKFYSRLEDDLKVYDAYLLWGYSEAEERGRPNIVFKVAGSYPAAIEIAERLNSMGMGTNITVVYTVSQEIILGMAEMRGMAKALRKGIPITRVYVTNMGGRLEDHLREVEAENLLKVALRNVSNKEELLRELAEGFGALDKYEKLSNASLDEKISFLCSHSIMGRSLLHPAFIKALAKAGLHDGDRDAIEKDLLKRDKAIAYSGIFVTQRVYKIFFSPENRPKWIEYLQGEYGLTREQAENILNMIDVLPASKRKPIDTLLTLASKNMTHTEFPNHQLKVLNTSRKADFKLIDYAESVMQEYSEELLAELMKRPDFVKAYEIPPDLAEKLKEVGIKGDFGTNGLKVEEWPEYGPCVKTMKQFSEGYIAFRARCVEFVKQVAKELNKT